MRDDDRIPSRRCRPRQEAGALVLGEVGLVGDQDPRVRLERQEFAGSLCQAMSGYDEHRLGDQAEPPLFHDGGGHGQGPLRFDVVAGAERATFEIKLSEERAEFRQAAGPAAFATIRGNRKSFADWFNDDPPIIHFANGDFLVFNELFELTRGTDRTAFDPTKVTPWSWDDINLKKESQGPNKEKDAVQYRVIEKLLAGQFGEFDIVFDGDGSGKVADIVALMQDDRKLKVLLIHYKYSGAESAGARIGDLYAVCGQAQKSVHWRENPRKMLKHLLHQEELRRKSRGQSRFERGSQREVQQLANISKELSVSYEVVIVQPGLSKAKIAPAFLDVLGATETFLAETFSMPLSVIASA